MNAVPSSLTGPPHLDGPVAEQLLSHLSAEESSLAAMLHAVQNVHHALRYLNDDQLREALEEESLAIAVAGELQQQRWDLRVSLATALGVERDEATLGRVLTGATGALREGVARFRTSLAEMSAELERLNRQNGAMIRQSLSLTRGIIGRLTGQRAAGDTYNAEGNRDEVHVGSLVQWGG